MEAGLLPASDLCLEVVAPPSLTIVGLDAATFDVIDPLIAAGDLPHLASLIARGARGVLRSTTHPLTPLAWTTMVTGVNAARHGIWDFSERDESGYQLRLVNGSFVRAPALWTRLSAAGRRVGVVNVPFTWPSPTVNGFAVAGLDASARDDGMTYPRDLLEKLHAKFGPLLLDHSFPLDDRGAIDLDFVRRACTQKVEIVEWLASEYAPELLFVVFMAADHVHHLAWPDWKARGRNSDVAEVYRILDGSLGRLLALVGEDGNVAVVSDHGGGSLEGVLNLNAWLATCGYLAYTRQLARQRGGLSQRVGHELFELRRKLPQSVRSTVKQRAPGLREWSYRFRTFSNIDWSQTRAFSYGTFGNIVVNVRGRERDGIVERGAEYERVRDEVAESALALRSPSGDPIVAAVHRREDLYDGPELGKIPDLIVEFRDYAWLGKGTMTRSESIWDSISIAPNTAASYQGSHRYEGIVVLAGPSVRPGIIPAAEILDIAPTMLYLLEEPIPTELEGRLLAEAIEPTLLDRRPPEDMEQDALALPSKRMYDEQGAAEVEERLRNLGYLD
jgi:predicted AlkP superfamily phosphohydrolase/phosphomutase